jgi:UDPglucose 6-dehydrogenase
MIRVGFAGMTHLGINSAAAAAARGFEVVAYDSDRLVIEGLRQRKMPVHEPGLEAMVTSHGARLNFTTERADLSRCDVVYISIDVPTDDEANSDLAPVRAMVADAVADLGSDAVLVILCQVPPGFSRAISLLPPERVLYQVETLIFGRAVERALYPERIIVGCHDPSRPLPQKYRSMLEAFECPILPMRYESAELAKIAINFCLVASIGVANTLAEVSEAVGADWQEIVPALKSDRRIGAYSYLDPGLGIAGGNLERDLRTVLDLAAKRDLDVGIVKAWIGNSNRRKDWCWRVLAQGLLTKGGAPRIAVLGLAYKENTASTRNSAALALLARLNGMDVRVHDPAVATFDAPGVTRCAAALDCAKGADALVIATPWPEYRTLAIHDLARVMTGRLIVDPYRVLDGHGAVAAGFEYRALGMPALMPACGTAASALS